MIRCLLTEYGPFDLLISISGKVYRLRSPNRRYLTSLSSYDSSNPTKDWDFPDLYDNLQSGISDILSYPNCQPNHSDEVCDIWSPKLDNFPDTPEKVNVLSVHYYIKHKILFSR